MKFIDKLERKFGRFGIPNLTVYIIGCYAIDIKTGTTTAHTKSAPINFCFLAKNNAKNGNKK